MEITLTSIASARLVQSLIKLGASKRPLTPKRKALIQEMAARLGVDPLALAGSPATGLWTPKPLEARKALYLAASCLLAIDWEDADAAALEDLARALELGAEARKLDFQAREGPKQLLGIRAVGVARSPAEPRPRLARSSKPARRRAGGAARRENREAPKLAPFYTQPPFISGVVGALLVLILLAAMIPKGAKDKDQTGAAPSLSSADFTERYNEVIAAWNKCQEPGAAPSLIQLRDIRGNLTALIKDGGDPKLAALLQELLASSAFERQWAAAVENELTELTLAIARDRDREDYARARERLASFPAAVLTKAELQGQFEIIVKDLDNWTDFTEAVQVFITMKEPGVGNLLAADQLCLDRKEGLTTAAFDRLQAWFARQERYSDRIFDRFVAAMDRRDLPKARRMLGLLQRVRPKTCQAYLERKIRALLESRTRKAPPGLAIATGTGFFIDRQHILTNAHVVGFLDSVSLQINGKAAEGRVVARDPALDLALVKTTLPGRPLEFNDDIRGGLNVFVYGYGVLAGSNNTFLRTRGFLSAVKPDQLIVDAKVNPGNSGGPLLDADGRWVGVIVAKTLSSQQVDSFGIAINGRAALSWVRAQGIAPPQVRGSARGSAPPPELEASIVRIEAVVLSRR